MNPSNEFADLPYPSDFAESEAHRLLLDGAIQTIPLGLQDEIASRSGGDSELWESVMINCRGNSRLAELLLDKHENIQRLQDPKYTKDAVKLELDRIEAQIGHAYEVIDSSE